MFLKLFIQEFGEKKVGRKWFRILTETYYVKRKRYYIHENIYKKLSWKELYSHYYGEKISLPDYNKNDREKKHLNKSSEYNCIVYEKENVLNK